MSDLSDTARQVAAAWFGAMREGGSSHLRFAMVESKPSEKAQAGLDELVAAGVISREDEPTGAVTYRPLVSCHEHFVWAARRMFSGEATDSFRLIDPIPADEKPRRRAGKMTVARRALDQVKGEGGGDA